MSLTTLYKPTQDEAARQAFVGALKSWLNGALETQIEAVYEAELAPAYASAHGRPPIGRNEAASPPRRSISVPWKPIAPPRAWAPLASQAIR